MHLRQSFECKGWALSGGEKKTIEACTSKLSLMLIIFRPNFPILAGALNWCFKDVFTTSHSTQIEKGKPSKGWLCQINLPASPVHGFRKKNETKSRYTILQR